MTGSALVTGARGFIGRHVARHLAQLGWQVAGLGHGEWEPGERLAWGVSRWQAADVSLENLVAAAGRPSLIVHCAGGASVGISVDRPHEDFHRTVSTTAAVLEFARRRTDDAAVVLPSSTAVYGNAAALPTAESAPLAPVSPYGVHKQMAEQLCRFYSRQYAVRTAVVRFFSVYGTHLRKQLLWDACERLSRNEPPRFFGDGDETRDWLHVADAARLLETAARHASSEAPAVNGGTGRPVSVREILAELFRLLGRPGEPIFSGASRPGEPKHYLADIAAAHSWGWAPTIDWRDGLQEYVSWYRQAR
jgi:UDP-glucose 4-epimerase